MIAVDHLSIRQGSFALRDVSFDVSQGAYAVLMGRSGCGKTTILEAICGLRPITGRIRLGSRDVTGLRPGERGVGYVPQDHALFPGMPVRAQLAFALVVRRAPHAVVARRVDELAGMLGIEHILDRDPATLSGGESQRVSLGRALAAWPSVLCLDEPLNALDEATHEEITVLLSDIHRRAGVTVLHVTHSRREADRLSDCLLELEDGEVRRVPAGREDG